MVIADSLDYGALKRAHVNEISDALWERGMKNMLADRMKGSLESIPRIDTSKSNTYTLNAKCQPKNEEYYHEQNSCYNSNSFGFDHCQPLQYTVNHPIFNVHNNTLTSQPTIMEQMTTLTSMCEMVCQIFQKKQEEKRIEEEQATKVQNRKLHVCYDDDDDEEDSNSLKDNIISELSPCSAVTPSEPIDSLSMGDEHLDTILATESDEFIKSCVENLVLNPSEFEGKNGCDVPSCFITFSNILFDADYDFESVDDQSLHNEDVSEIIFSNPLFEEEIISIKKNQYHFNAESDLVESMLNRDSSIISSSSRIDSLLAELAGELTLLKSIPPGIDKTDCHPENEIRLSQRLLYDNSSPRPSEEFNFENSNAEIESFSPSPIPNEDSDSFMEENDLFLAPDDPMLPSIEDDDDSEWDILFLERLLHDDPIPLMDTLDFSNVVRVFLPLFTYPVTSFILHPFENKDTIFDPCITINHFCSFKPGLSHRCRAFKKFNTHRSHLNEWSMIINGKNIPTFFSSIPENLKTLAKGFYPSSLNFLSFNWESFISLNAQQIIQASLGKRRGIAFCYTGFTDQLKSGGKPAINILGNYNPMDDEPMWASNHVVALTPCSTITIPETANEFAIKGNHLNIVKENQFDGRTKTDPHKHIHEFLRIYDMFKYRDIENEVVRLMMVPLSLTGEAKTRLDELNEGTIET
nr:reverse transcriptase domain-containing protein [Tanacetum cinerariifolium]